MAAPKQTQDQNHPQEKKDREIVNRLLQEEPTDYNLAELARLRIRYQNFPGARETQKDLDLLLNKWQLTETTLFEKTRQIHLKGQVYRKNSNDAQEDWS
ncbi:DUF3288 domain-containing protein [Aphanothece hegewaldii CCALA 016]|uniref:DUF3288 domain-containing protein n=1 Tax=Aphanothece hegewaldii CCALA 016 TaxID=2107694 RepID=A0A2T1M070_9CHRO|nr:DUF3288 family protein [Aphanothece hegewaldii]PSF38076.1 DUF3288 domain-containing protein [Aphanothece hegewaldii CCALA 016]